MKRILFVTIGLIVLSVNSYAFYSDMGLNNEQGVSSEVYQTAVLKVVEGSVHIGDSNQNNCRMQQTCKKLRLIHV